MWRDGKPTARKPQLREELGWRLEILGARYEVTTLVSLRIRGPSWKDGRLNDGRLNHGRLNHGRAKR
jgi:hypothetical protein